MTLETDHLQNIVMLCPCRNTWSVPVLGGLVGWSFPPDRIKFRKARAGGRKDPPFVLFSPVVRPYRALILQRPF